MFRLWILVVEFGKVFDSSRGVEDVRVFGTEWVERVVWRRVALLRIIEPFVRI